MKKARALNAVTLIWLLAACSIGAAAATFLAISGTLSPAEQSPQHIWWFLLGNVALLVALAGVILHQMRPSWKSFMASLAASRLQRRVVLSFSLVTVLPTLAVSLFSALFFNLGIQAWFNDQVNTAVEESLAVAEAYLNEHRENIRVDALALADDLNRFADMALVNPVEFNRFVSAQAARRSLTEVVVFQRNRIIAQGRLSFSVAFESLPQNALERAASGEVVILQSGQGDEDRVRALIRLDALRDAYLLVGRLIDTKVISHMEKTQGAVNEYRNLKAQLSHLQWTFSAVFVMLTLVLLLTSVWYGLIFASRLTTPIARLAVAAERVRAGDYSGRVQVDAETDEVGMLSRTFNRMVDQLNTQRSELIEANRQLDDRRHFIEAVLAGVSAGVVALNAERRVTLFNRSASAMLASPEQTLEGKGVNEILPGIHELLIQAESAAGQVAQSSVTIPMDGTTRTLHIRVRVEQDYEGRPAGYIVTFDDITPLVAAQRNAAWSDVARRVAHEIKNPLTPIALSAERLKRKYLKYMEGEEAENFTRYIDTIARHVADIGRMVEEFVSFARMPGAVMKEADLVQIVRRALFSEQVTHPGIRYTLECDAPSLPLECDERQLAQVISNVLKNAAEAIEGEQAEQGEGAKQGEIRIRMRREEAQLLVTVEDSGPGFPPDKINSMLDPYVTTRSKGTGLGLAIVKKIVEEHGGTLSVSNRPEGGARVVLSFSPQCDINGSAKA